MKKIGTTLGLLLIFVCMLGADSCNPARSSSGVGKATVQLQTGSDGLTAEQRNIAARLSEDNKPGSIKHLYVISAYSGQVLIYSTVKGKITSGGKRLAPSTVGNSNGFTVQFGDQTHFTNEVLGDDGTYGSSSDYLFWWDVNGVYHQHYVSGGQILHVSSQPLSVKSVVINMEVSPKK